jgi:hypothetical protein
MICLVGAGLKIRLASCEYSQFIVSLALRNKFMLRWAHKAQFLFDFDLCTRGLDLFLDLIRLLSGHAFLDRFWRAFYQCLGFREAKPRDGAADFLDHRNLVCAHFCEDDVKRGFFLLGWSCCPGSRATCRGSRRNRYWRSGAYAPFFLKLFYQSSNLKHRKVAELLHQFVCICHFSFFLLLPPPKAFEELKPVATGSDNFRLLL